MKLFEFVTSIVQFNKFFTTFLLPMFGVSSFKTGNFKERLEDEAANVIAAVNFSSVSLGLNPENIQRKAAEKLDQLAQRFHE